jgi:hypothetical protein
VANPRNAISFEGIAAPSDYATFHIDNSTITYDATKAGGAATTMIGKAVTLSAAGTVALTADGDAVVGKLIKVEADNKATVQVGGFMSLPSGASATLTRGFKIVGDLDGATKGYIREVASATAAEINKGRGMIIDAADTAAVVVWLG